MLKGGFEQDTAHMCGFIWLGSVASDQTPPLRAKTLSWFKDDAYVLACILSGVCQASRTADCTVCQYRLAVRKSNCLQGLHLVLTLRIRICPPFLSISALWPACRLHMCMSGCMMRIEYRTYAVPLLNVMPVMGPAHRTEGHARTKMQLVDRLVALWVNVCAQREAFCEWKYCQGSDCKG